MPKCDKCNINVTKIIKHKEWNFCKPCYMEAKKEKPSFYKKLLDNITKK